jgi:hypothetical protein
MAIRRSRKGFDFPIVDSSLRSMHLGFGTKNRVGCETHRDPLAIVHEQ